MKDGSNKDHPISQFVITKTINLRGIKCDRKTISRDIDCLIALGLICVSFVVMEVGKLIAYLRNKK